MAPPGKADQFAMWNQDRRAVPLDADAAVLDVIIEGAQTGRFRFGEALAVNKACFQESGAWMRACSTIANVMGVDEKTRRAAAAESSQEGDQDGCGASGPCRSVFGCLKRLSFPSGAYCFSVFSIGVWPSRTETTWICTPFERRSTEKCPEAGENLHPRRQRFHTPI
jgi:hypothetical protein